MEITEINRDYNNKFYSAMDLSLKAFKALKNEKMDEDDIVLQTCLRYGLYDSMYDEKEMVGIKINLDKQPEISQDKDDKGC